MQPILVERQNNQKRFTVIEQRWSAVQNALRIENKQRKDDIYILSDNLQERRSTSQTQQNQKSKLLSECFRTLNEQVTQCKDNMEVHMEVQGNFRIKHNQKKNAYINGYTNDSQNFLKSISSYGQAKIKDLTSKIQSVDAMNKHKTAETVKDIKQGLINQYKQTFNNEKQNIVKSLNKIAQESTAQFDSIKTCLKSLRSRRVQSENKLAMMISSLSQQLLKASQNEIKEGQMTYDCLLKILEESCSRVQQMQLA